MPKIPIAPSRTISQIVETQLPAFVRDDYPQFVAFVKAYYEWLEKNGADVFECKVLNATANTVTLTSDASGALNDYQGMHIVVLNGPAKGYTRKIAAYDPSTNVVTLETTWELTNIPPANTKMIIRDTVSPGKLLDYRDIDKTLDGFLKYFTDEFLFQIPGNILADKRLILKHIKEFYQARGTENSYRFLFRILFNEEVEFYYPKVDVFRPSDARWSVVNVMRLTSTTDTFNFLNRQLVGNATGATATVESVVQSYVAGYPVTDLTVSNVQGQFGIDPSTSLPEAVKVVYPSTLLPQSNLGALTDLQEQETLTQWESPYQLLQALIVGGAGENYAIGDTITISGGGCISPGHAVVSTIFATYFNGRAQAPPTMWYLEPFFGPALTVNNDGNPLDDGVCIPGLYFWSDVHSTYTTNDLLTLNEMILASSETTTDNFYVGDEISLVSGTGTGQKRNVVSYNGTTKIITVDVPFTTAPDATTGYSILHTKGGIKSVSITDFGLGFTSAPTVTINSSTGSGALLPPVLGFVGQTAGAWTMGRNGGVGSAPTTTDSFPSSNKVIQDSYYYQDFSYDLRVGATVDKYRDAVKTLLHPAGLIMFGSVVLHSQPQTNFLETLRTYVLQLDPTVNDLRLTTNEKRVIQVSIPPPVIGATNKSLDWMKFIAFPPNTQYTNQYPYPNNTYWTSTGPGNTQIANLQNIVIGSLVNFPNRRTKINADTYVSIDNADTSTLVGPVGQSRAAIARNRFTGFPPYEGFAEAYPAPNNSFWQSGYGDTQIENLKNIPLSDLITNPQNVHSNICVDSDIAIYSAGSAPNGIMLVGLIAEYPFIQGIDDQIVYNVAQNVYTPQDIYDASVGMTMAVASDDPTWVSDGLSFSRADNTLVNASAIPVNLEQCTVVIVCKTNDTTVTASIVNCIGDNTKNGFSIEMQENGGVSFRCQYAGVSRTVMFPDASITADNYFMATLRFENGLLQGTLNKGLTKATQFASYPTNPVSNSDGWLFGKNSADYVTQPSPASLYDNTLFGSGTFQQAAQGSTTVSNSFFDGTAAYAMFYDRALYDFEVDFIYTTLQTLLSDRGITLP